MKFLDRLFVLLLAIIIVALSVGMSGVYFELFSQYKIANFIADSVGRVELLVVAVVLFLIAARIIQLSFVSKKKNKQTIIGEGKLGKVRITIEAINEFVKDVAKAEANATNIKSEIKETETGLNIVLKLSVYDQVKIPDLADQLQQHVKAEIENSIGAEVNEVEVIVKAIEKKKEGKHKLQLD